VDAALQARERLAKVVPVEVVDSRSASLGLGFQVVRGAELAQQGMSAVEIAAALRAAIHRYHVVFSVESVEHLRERGQVGRSAAMIAEALQLKPLLRIDEGQIIPYERARTRHRAIHELADFVCELPAVERCAVLHATNETDADRLHRTIAGITGLPSHRLTVHQIGPAVAAQVGPGALGVAVVETDIV
jgi:DegV family protein with EDD domain